MKHFFNMKMVEIGSIVDHLNEFNMVTSKLNSINVNFDEEARALLILCYFIESWNSLVMMVSNSIYSLNTLKFDDVIGVILNKENRRKISGGSSTSSSFFNAKNQEGKN
jgi:hypothetical protein